MELGVNLGYWGGGNDADNLALAQEADALGYTVAWVAEAYGSDAPTVLAFVAAQTERIDIGSAIFQIPGRTPANCAMTAATLDTLSGGRFRLGLGVSGPQVSEGWHGVRFDKPLARTREYSDIVKMALSREKVRYEGQHYVLPLPDGPGKALQLTVHPVREHIPMYLAAVDKTLEGFDVVPTMPIVVGDDPRACADPVRWYAALYVGGMGSREKNFYNQLASRMGFEQAAKQIQDLYLSRDYDGAAAAVPYEFLDQTALLGSKERIAEKMQELSRSGVTTLTLSPFGASQDEKLAALRTAVEALELSGVG